MRFADFKKKRSEAPPETPPGAPPLFPAKAAPPAPASAKAPPLPHVAPDAPKLAAQRQAARGAYGRAIAKLREVLAARETQPAGALAALAERVDEFIALSEADNQALLALTAGVTPEDPAISHSVNVAIYALGLGVNLGCPRSRLSALGLAALLHDLDRTRSCRLAHGSKPAAEQLRGLKDSLSKILAKLHGGAAADLDARIVGLCDVYETLTHGYGGVAPVAPRDAFKKLIELKENFDHALVKRLLDRLSPFPPGSLVKLADGRVGCVVAVNAKMLTRPIVEIWLQSDGKAEEPPTSLDLAQELLIGIAGAPDEAKLATSPAAARVRALRVWSDSPPVDASSGGL